MFKLRERALSKAHSSIQWHGAGARCRTLDEEEEGGSSSIGRPRGWRQMLWTCSTKLIKLDEKEVGAGLDWSRLDWICLCG